ncbi:Uncharacterised protein [Brevundimonas vesicularis]|uniref:Uncharacterized protein n=1 Tax=Brevundimonas vesicularis TaxID=41276 RepID=A0A2X1BGQ0_BREVE|nr:hypothetical protein [Brevundimonas vesicularis]SPU55610.1 Uncharacterised protein [Brevundimonas vesicularis]
MTRREAFIELNRRFRDLTENEREDPASLAFWGFHESQIGMAWDELLQSERVVILAEAGAGKTREMQAQTRRINADGKVAFFIPVEALDREGVRPYLSMNKGVAKQFDDWLADPDQQAWFFIDAVDELKLTDGKLSSALAKLAGALGEHQHRAHILVSCRPTDWRPVQDMETFETLLPINAPVTEQAPTGEEGFLAPFSKSENETPAPAKSKIPPARCVFLLPLDRNQVEAFANARGVENTKAFREEIHRRDAWTFARRPLDLQGLIDTWRETGKLGSRREQHATDVVLSLRDDPERPDQGVLTPERAVEGVQRIALAMLLTRARTIRSPEQAVAASSDQSSLNAEEVLTDWTPKEVRALLRRAIFDPATYGRVRFHHRSVQEYLAAQRLAYLRGRGLPMRQLRRLLFAETYGEVVLIPSMRPVAAWLANGDDRIAEEILRREPEALVLHGDPETLPLSTRIALVRAYVAAYGGGDWRGLEMPISEVQRLASAELKDVIRECWAQAYENEEVREFLLKLMWLGSIGECADLANEALWDESLGAHARILASRALEECKRHDLLAKAIDDISVSNARWPDRVVYGFTAEAFPQAVSAKDLAAIIARTPEPKRTVGGFSWALLNQVDELDPKAATTTALRTELQELIWSGRDGADWWRPKSRFGYVTPALARLCRRQLEAGVQDKKLLWAAITASRFHDEQTLGRDDFEALRQWFAASDVNRETMFWLEVDAMQAIAPTDDLRHRAYYAQHHSLVGHLKKEDWDWLIKGLAKGRAADLRGVTLEVLISLWHERGREPSELEALRWRVADSADMSAALTARTTPQPDDGRMAEWARQDKQHKQRRAAKEAKTRQSWSDWLPKLSADPDRAFRGRANALTVWNLWNWLGYDKGGETDYGHLARRNWRRIREVVNVRVGELFEASLRQYWRNNAPPIKSRRKPNERNLIFNSQGMALTGLLVEAASDPAWARKLSRTQARRAAEWAMLELNGFPDWFADLADAHPTITAAVVNAEIDGDLADFGPGGHSHAISGLRYGDADIRQLGAPHLFKVVRNWPRLSRNEQTRAAQISLLEHALATLVLNGVQQGDLADVAAKKFRANPRQEGAALWLKALASCDLRRAVTAMQKALKKLPTDERGARGMSWFGPLFGERDSQGGSVSLDADTDLLLDLTRLAYECVRLEDDVQHDGPYSPGPRDEAETARNRLIGAIIGKPGPEAHHALLTMAEEPLFAHMKDRLRLMARQRASNDSEPAALKPAEVRVWEERYETPPKNRDELFQVMLDRLDDMRHEILHHDFNDRADLAKIAREEDMQPRLALKLANSAKGQFHVTREEEVASKKETDIRLLAASMDKAVIEIKIGDHCSLNELMAAIDEQLIKKYLRHQSCSAGCLLVTYAGGKGFECPTTGAKIEFAEVIARLKAHAKAREQEEKGRILVDVVGLNLCDPLTTSASD